MNKSLYLHIPFCRKKCIYCDFYSIPCERGLSEQYIKVLCRQIASLDADFSTIYIGGGTPTVLDIDLIDKLLISLKRFSFRADEFTFEANPESLNKDKIKLLLNHGVSRLSIGAQSFFDKKLKQLGRIHSSKAVEEAVLLAEKEGFCNISIDLIFGVWGENLKNWQKELKYATQLPVKHISAYALTYEPTVLLYQKLKGGLIKPLEDDIVSKMYGFTIDYLPKKNFLQYEVSSFAKIGHQCRHNLNYWNGSFYLGLGPSAASYTDGVRSKNISDIDEYIFRVKEKLSLLEEKEFLSAQDKAKELAAIKIRCKEGIDFKGFKEKTGFDFLKLEKESLAYLFKESLIEYRKKGKRKTGISLTKRGFLFCDRVSTSFL